jgi:hypothetical protein
LALKLKAPSFEPPRAEIVVPADLQFALTNRSAIESMQ